MAGCLNDLVWRKNIYEIGNKIKNIQGNRTPDYGTCTRNKDRKPRQMFQENEMEVLKNIWQNKNR